MDATISQLKFARSRRPVERDISYSCPDEPSPDLTASTQPGQQKSIMTGLSDQISATGQPAWLNQISEKRLPAQCKPSGFTYCPSMNLIAVASVDEQVNVYRLNGQHVLGGVYGTPPKNGSGDNEDDDYGIDDDGETREVKAIGWKADGRHMLQA